MEITSLEISWVLDQICNQPSLFEIFFYCSLGFFPLFFWKLCLHSKVSLTLLWCKYNLFWGLVKSSFRWNQKKRTTKTQRIMETFGKKCITGLTSTGKISVPEDWSPLLLSALGWFSVSWDWMQVLATCRFHAGTRQANCAAWTAPEVGNLGRPHARYVGAQPIRTGGGSGQGSPLAAASLPRLSGVRAWQWQSSAGCARGWVSASQPAGSGHKARSPTSTAGLTWLVLCFDNCNGSFPYNTISSPTWSCVQTKGQTLIWFKSSWLCWFHAYVY